MVKVGSSSFGKVTGLVSIAGLVACVVGLPVGWLLGGCFGQPIVNERHNKNIEVRFKGSLFASVPLDPVVLIGVA